MKRQSLRTSTLRTSTLLLLASCLTYGLMGCRNAEAQDTNNPLETSASAPDKEWYYGPTAEKAPQKTPGRQRAELRASQRLARLESMRWYGSSASRPTVSAIPFTSMYSPAWTRPSGRLSTWNTNRRPVVIVSPYFPAAYR